MAGRVLIDTNIAIAILAGNREVEAKLLQSHLLLCPIVIAELYYGAFKSTRKTENLSQIREFAQAYDMLPTTHQTAFHYGEIKNALRTIAKPIPENDIWIAAYAMELNIHLVTRDPHFTHVPGLRLDLWQ